MQQKIADTLVLEAATEVIVHRNLSFTKYFSGYSRETDGTVNVATYSFDMSALKEIHRLMPFSIFYVAPKYEAAAKLFLRRFPLYIVYVVEGLHTKCIFFEKSKRALIGSQNLFSPTSGFDELSVEMRIAEMEASKFKTVAFEFPNKRYLRAPYLAQDINQYKSTGNGVDGYPYLPCHTELEYWQALGETDTHREFPTYHYIYLVLEYVEAGGTTYLAFDRHYQYCGELDPGAFQYLRDTFPGRVQDHTFLDEGANISQTAPFKDQFAQYHPIAYHQKAKRAHYFDRK